MIVTREPFEGYPDTKASFLAHKVEKINLFAIGWANPHSNPKLWHGGVLRDQQSSLIQALQRVASIAAPKPPSTATGLRTNILRSNEIASSLDEYQKFEAAMLDSIMTKGKYSK